MLNIFAWWNPPKALPLALTQTQIKDFLRLLDKIESEKLRDNPLRLEVTGYMLRASLSHQKLMERYEAICPDYRQGSFFLKLALDNAGRWAELYRGHLLSQITKREGLRTNASVQALILEAFEKEHADFVCD